MYPILFTTNIKNTFFGLMRIFVIQECCPDIILVEHHLRTIPLNGNNWLSFTYKNMYIGYLKYDNLFFLIYFPSWFGDAGHINIGKGPHKDHFTKVLLQLAQ